MIASVAGLVALVSLVAIGLPSTASHVEDPITVTFAADDMGFNVTSLPHDISNVVVLLCDGTDHKHDELTGHYFNHTETQAIQAVWVKAGPNAEKDDGDSDPMPPSYNNGGTGQYFPNEGDPCDTPPTSSTPPTTSAPPETTPPPTTTSEIPFFPSATALALGTVGALGGALLILRRRN